MTEETMTMHAALARALKELGVETLFGLMGDSNLFMCDSFVRQQGGRYVPATHEANAVLMACGHAAMTGEVGACTITQGPAVSNAITALIEGVKSSHRIVLLCGDTPSADPDHPQTVRQRELIEGAGAGYLRIRSPETAVADVSEAFRRAWVERRPVALNMPTEMMWENTTYGGVRQPRRPAAVQPTDGEAMDNAVGILAAARRPVILAGRGAVHAKDSLVRLADRIGSPVCTTLKAKGLFSGHPYNLGVHGTLSTPGAIDVISGSDCVVVFGAGLNRFTQAGGSFFEDRRIIQVDDMVETLGRLVEPDVVIAADPALVADAFLHWLDEAEIPSSQATDSIDLEALKEGPPLPSECKTPGTVDFPRALDRINAAMDPERLFVTDAGRFLQEVWWRIDVSKPANMLLSIGVGAIGLGIGHAIGAGVARPGQPILFVTGDGGLMMGGLAEITSVVREKLDMICVICNDAAYGAEYVQFEDRQMDPGMSQFEWPSLAAVARSMGAKGLQVTSDQELDAAIADIEGYKTGDGPLVIELMLDPASVTRLHHVPQVRTG
ncbi:MAG: thiamine pyrophosphate-binding protein [Pseudomonadota bacterium]